MMKKIVSTTAIIVTVLAVSACGGGGTDTGVSAISTTPGFDGRDQDMLGLLSRSAQTFPTPVSQLPLGQATYTGLSALKIDPTGAPLFNPNGSTADLIGVTTLEVNFSSSLTGGSISGEISDFVDIDGNDRAGQVSFDPTFIVAAIAGNSFGSTMSGSFEDSDGNINTIFSGEYSGAATNAGVSISILGNGRVAGGNGQFFEVQTIAER